MYTSFLQIYEEKIMHFLIFFAWGQTKDVDITFWHLFFRHELLPIIPIISNRNIFNQYSLNKEKRISPFQWYITHWVKSFPLLVAGH